MVPKQNNTKIVSRAEQQRTEHIYCITPNLRDRFIEVFGVPKLNDVLLTEAPAVISEVTVVTFPARAVHFD